MHSPPKLSITPKSYCPLYDHAVFTNKVQLAEIPCHQLLSSQVQALSARNTFKHPLAIIGSDPAILVQVKEGKLSFCDDFRTSLEERLVLKL